MTDIESGAATPITGGDDGGESEAKPDELDTGEQRLSGDPVISAGREESAQVADQAMAAHDLGGNARALARRARGRRWGAVFVVVAAGAGILAGVVRRRRHRRRRSRWPWKRR